MAHVLTTASTVQCPHGGQLQLVTSNTRVSAGARVLLESDVHVIAGCPFTDGSRSSPCVRVDWDAGAAQASIGGTAPLVETSVGTCKNAEGGVQGTAIVVITQRRTEAR